MKSRGSSAGIRIAMAVLLAGAIPGAIWLSTPRRSLPSVGVAAANVSGRACDLQENPVDPLAHPDGRAIVLFFLGIDCPISNR